MFRRLLLVAVLTAGCQVATVPAFRRPATTLQVTNNPFDLAIDDSSTAAADYDYFMLDDRQGDHFYTRSGSFYPDANHTLLHNPSGMTLAPPITLPADATASQVRADGVVLVQRPGIADWQEVGTIQIARFANPAALVTVGGGLYQSSSLSGPARLGRPANNGFGELKAGVLEK